VRVQVTAQRGPELGDVVGQRNQLGVRPLELGQVLGDAARVRLDDRGRRLGADALEVLEGVRPDPAVELGGVEGVDDRGGGAERADPVAGLAGALQEEGDPPERGRGRERCGQLRTCFAAFLACFDAFF
jgi:hypothetical protein